MLLRNQTATPCPMKGEKAVQVACGRVRANRNDSPAGVGVLWRRGCNPALTQVMDLRKQTFVDPQVILQTSRAVSTPARVS